MRLALADAGLAPAAIDYVNAHGTATELGDIAESQATHRGASARGMPISSLKGYIGHTLGACGALEAWLTIEMMREGWFAPTLNLESVDPRCAPLDYVRASRARCAVDVRDEQQLRVRRRQHVARLPALGPIIAAQGGRSMRTTPRGRDTTSLVTLMSLLVSGLVAAGCASTQAPVTPRRR